MKKVELSPFKSGECLINFPILPAPAPAQTRAQTRPGRVGSFDDGILTFGWPQLTETISALGVCLSTQQVAKIYDFWEKCVAWPAVLRSCGPAVAPVAAS